MYAKSRPCRKIHGGRPAKPEKSRGSTAQWLSLCFFQLDRAFDRHLIHDSKGLRLVRRHEMIPIQRSFNGFVGLTGVMYVDLIEPSLDLENILGVPLDIRSLPLEAARRLVDHDAGIGQRKP